MSSRLASQATIPADWIANELSLTPLAVLKWADRLRLTYHRDDSGREWIAESDGRRIIEEVQRAGRGRYQRKKETVGRIHAGVSGGS